MLLEARDYARDNGCAYTVFTGDFWHSKRNVPHGLVRWAIDLLQDWPGRKLAIVGNHDLSFSGQASIPTQPIGVLFQAGVLEWLQEDIVTEDYTETAEQYQAQVDGAAADEGQRARVRVQWSPANYRDDIDHNPWNYGLTRQENVDWAIKVAHGTITLPGKPFPFHTIPMDTIPTEGMDICLFGHPHWDVGIHTIKDCTFACLGSLGRTQHTDDNEQRVMRLLQVQLSETEVYFDELPLGSAAPASELFLTKAGSDVEVTKAMRKFVRSLEEAITLEEGSLDEVLSRVGGGNVDGRARLRLMVYLDKAGLHG